MRNLLREVNLPLPKFEMNSFFVVTFKRKEHKGLVLGKSRLGEKFGERFGKRFGESSEKILAIIKENERISAKEISELIGISQRAVEKNIAILRRKGVLKRVGPAKGGHWEIVE